MTADSLAERVASQSWIAAMPDAERGAMLERVRALARTHPDLAGRATFEMPYDTEVLYTRHALMAHLRAEISSCHAFGSSITGTRKPRIAVS